MSMRKEPQHVNILLHNIHTHVLYIYTRNEERFCKIMDY